MTIIWNDLDYAEVDNTPSANEVAEHYYENAVGHMLNMVDDSKQPEEEDDDDYRDDEPYDGYGDDNYCGACMSDPCMCSDREQTSTIHDF